MAILKHIASKNADYGKSFEYLIFQHNEFTGKAILDESGNMIMREEYYLDGINCDPSTFDKECEQLNEKRFRQEHSSEIALYETARKVLKKGAGDDKLPSMKMLKAKKEKLPALKTSQYEAYQNLRGYQKELKTVCTNVDMILGNDRSRQPEQQKSQDIS